MRIGAISISIVTVLAAAWPQSAWAAEKPSEPAYWSSHFLVYAVVEAVTDPSPDPTEKTIHLQSKITLSGDFDAGSTLEVAAHLSTKGFGVGFKIPSERDKVLVLLERNDQSYSIPAGRFDFMPSDHAAICVVSGFGDPRIRESLKAVQALRHRETEAWNHPDWEKISVVLARGESIGPADAKSGERTVVLKTRGAAAGKFDARQTPELSIRVNLDKTNPGEKPTKLIFALVALQREGNSYLLCPYALPFMPGDHSAIYFISNPNDDVIPITKRAAADSEHAAQKPHQSKGADIPR